MKTEEIVEYLDGMIAEMVEDGQHRGAMRVGVVRDELARLYDENKKLTVQRDQCFALGLKLESKLENVFQKGT